MNADGLIFDYGGTLDTGGHHWARIFWEAYQHAAVPVTEQQFRDAYVFAERTLGSTPVITPDFTFRRTLEQKISLQLAHLSLPSQWSGVLAERAYAHAQRCTAHSRAVLLTLRTRFPMVLVSNFYGNISTVLREFGLDGLFKHVIESAVVGIRKPDPRIFSLGVEALQLPAQRVVVVGDSMDKDMVPAKKAGCQTVWMHGKGWTDDEPDGREADEEITDLSELTALLNV